MTTVLIKIEEVPGRGVMIEMEPYQCVDQTEAERRFSAIVKNTIHDALQTMMANMPGCTGSVSGPDTKLVKDAIDVARNRFKDGK